MAKKFILTENEELLFSKLKESDLDDVWRIITEGNVRIDCLDEHGMTPLQHAAYKGNYDLCKFLLDNGADINSHHHDNKYTTLMFASLTGKKDVVALLLENGASITAINKINRTASQLAAFVGNHDIVSMISNFIPQEEIDWYTVAHDKQSEPKLLPELSKPLHQLVIKTNISPVRLAIFLQETPALLQESKKVCRTLEHLSGRQFNDSNNDMISMKLHHIAFVIRSCAKYVADKVSSDGSSIPSDALQPLIKHWIKSDENGGLPLNLEQFVRQSIKEYPFQQCPLLHQFVRTLAPVEVGSEPSALSVFVQAVSGQRPLDDSVACYTCLEPKAEKKCSACKVAQYCNKCCQKLHWFTHKLACPKLAKQYAEECKLSQDKVQEVEDGNTKSEELPSDLMDETLHENMKNVNLDSENVNSKN